MKKDEYKLDRTKLTPEQRAQLADFEQHKEQLNALQDIADMTQEVVNILGDQQSNDSVDKLGALLLDIRESLGAIKDKENPEVPDYSKSVVDAVSRMEKTLSSAIKSIDVKPQIKVDSPQINVDSPAVDLKGVEQAFTKAVADIPKAFDKAVKDMPQTPEADYSPLLEAWDGISEQLVSIENATRMKPMPGTMTGRLEGYDYVANTWRKLAAIESADDPGVYGLLVLNYDGSEISGGGSSSDSSVYDTGLYGTALYA